MSQKTFCTLAGCIFLAIAVLHLVRLIFGWEAVIGGWMVPKWPSVAALILFGCLTLVAFAQVRKS